MVTPMAKVIFAGIVILFFLGGGLYLLMSAESLNDRWAQYYKKAPLLFDLLSLGKIVSKHPRLHIWYLRVLGSVFILAGLLVIALLVAARI